MTDQERAVMKQALEALAVVLNDDYNLPYSEIVAATEALRAALAEPQEPDVPEVCFGNIPPVGWLESPHGEFRKNLLYKLEFPSQLLSWQIPLYAHLRAALAQPEPAAPTVVEPRPAAWMCWTHGGAYLSHSAENNAGIEPVPLCAAPPTVVEQPKVGETWHILRAGATACSTVTVAAITPLTVTFEPTAYGLEVERLPLRYVEFVELAVPATPPRAALTEECLLLLDTAMDSLKYHQEQTRPIHLTEVTIQAIQEFLEKNQIGGPK